MLPVFVSDKPFTPATAQRLCECVAHGLEDAVAVAADLGITRAALAALLENRTFLDAVLTERSAWRAPENTARRTREKADIALEELVARLHTLASNPLIDPAANIRAVQTIKSMTSLQRDQDAARSAHAAQGPTGNGFRLTIVMPRADGTVEPIVIGRGEGEVSTSGEALASGETPMPGGLHAPGAAMPAEPTPNTPTRESASVPGESP